MAEARFCTKCGLPADGSRRTMDGLVLCKTCDFQRAMLEAHGLRSLAQRAAKADIAAERTAAKVPMNIIAKSRSIDRGAERIADLIGQIEHDAWEAGFEAAVRIVEHEGGTAVAQTLRDALAGYWETQGVEREE